MKYRIRLLLCMVALLYGAASWAQYNPSNPSEPGAQYKLTLKATPSGAGTFNIGTTTTQNVGTSVSLKATAAEYYRFVCWKEGDEVVSTSASFSYTMPNRNVTLTAHFEKNYNPSNPNEPSQPVVTEPIVYYTLRLGVSPTSGGTTSPASGNKYQAGGTVTLKATTNSNYAFVNWTEDGEVISTSSSFTYTMPERDASLVANFRYTPGNPGEPGVPVSYKAVYLQSNPSGCCSFNVASGNKYEVGTTQTFKVSNISTYYTFKNWSIGDSIIGTSTQLSYKIPDRNTTLTANFSYNYAPGNPNEPGQSNGHAAFYGMTETVLCGETVMYPIYLEKTALSQNGFTMVAKGYMFDIAFPEGFEVGKGDILLHHINDQTYSTEELNDTTFRITVLGEDALASDNGIAMEIPVKIPDDAVKGMTYPVSLSHGGLIHPDNSETAVTVRSGGLYINGIIPPRIFMKKGFVNITSEQRGAVIHYTTDGTEPTLASATYTQPLFLEEGTLVKAVAVYASYISDVTEYVVTNNVAEMPEISFEDPLLTMTCETEGAVIHYTLDGSVPTEGSKVYSAPIEISAPCLVKAFAAGGESMADSDIEEYEILKCDSVSFEFSERRLTIACPTEDAVIHYTIDGTTPDASSSIYEGPIAIGHSCTVKAIAFKKGMLRSGVGEYEVIGGKLKVPMFEFDGESILRIVPDSIESDIYYSIEGISESFVLYKKPLSLTDNRAVYAYAASELYENSDTVTFVPNCFKVETVNISYKEPLLTITCETEGATIHYIIYGEEAEYTEPVEIAEPCTVYAYATKENFNNSDTLSYKIIRCAEPVISYTCGNVRISCENEGARIYYTIDGTVPDSTSLLYTEPFTASNNMTVKAVAYLDGALHSAVSDYIVDIFRVAAPAFAFAEPLLTINCETEDAAIHYIINGEEAEYTEPVEITEPCTVYAYATKENFNNSDTLSYNVLRCAEPVISYTGGNVRISCETEGARIYYTIDGTVPDSTSLLYTEPFIVSNNMTVKAVAYLDGALHSAVSDYIVDIFRVSAPTFAFVEPLLTINCETEGATIHYIINGEEAEYTEPVEITEPCTVYAYATKPYFNSSDTVSYTVEIKNMEFSSNGLSYNILSFEDYTCEVAKSRDAEYQGNINIPQTAERYGKSWNVVAIADEAFKDCHKVTSIIIPNSITAVGKSSLETGNRNMLLYCTSQTLPLMPKDFGNIIIDGVASFIQLVDSPKDGTSPTHDFSCPEPFTARKISYEHSYTQHTGIGFSEGWETIALPFDVQTVYHVTAQETIAPFKAGGTQRKFWLYELTDAGFVEAEAIKAYTPYIISMPNNEEYVSSYNLPGVVSFRAVNALVAPSASSTVSHGNKMLVATTHGVDAADNVYAINSYQATDNYREGSCFIANLRNVRPFEAYITSEQSLGAKAFSLKELASEMTGIEEVVAPSADIPACYNLSGQKVGAEYKGIVIRNGKKMLIK